MIVRHGNAEVLFLDPKDILIPIVKPLLIELPKFSSHYRVASAYNFSINSNTIGKLHKLLKPILLISLISNLRVFQ